MKPGDEVRLRLNPTCRGVLLRAEERRSGRFWLVLLDGGRRRSIRETQLEPAPSGPVTPLDLLSTGEYGAPSDFRRLLTHIRVSGHPADMLYSMETTNTDFKAYQFKPVIKILESPTGRVLLADEVGLGKTIEAGLIWTELRSRFGLRRLLVLCPKALREKWRRELSQKFGLDAIIADASGVLDRLRMRPSSAPLHLIASLSSLRQRKSVDGSNRSSANLLGEHLKDHGNHPCFDLLVVDEAHHGRNPDTSTHRLIATLVDASSYCAFLSATPVHNKQRDLLALLHLLDPDTFSDEGVLERIQTANAPLIRARDTLRDPTTTPRTLLADLDAASRHPMVSESEQLRLIRRELVDHGASPLTGELRSDLAYRLERVNLLGHVISRTRRRDVEENRVVRNVRTLPVPMTSLEKVYYDLVTDAVRDYAEEHDMTHGFLVATPQREMASCFVASFSAWFSESAPTVEEGTADTGDDEDGDADPVDRPLITHLRRFVRSKLFEMGVSESALGIALREVDSKYGVLLKWMREHLSGDPGDKFVVFSTFHGTVEYLSERLREDGYPNVVLRGGLKSSVDEILTEFQSDRGPQILLSTEVGAEGVDLQFCRLLVNYDLPWNPMRIEQRIGRLDRIGQSASKINILSLLHEDTIDFRIHEILFEKLEVSRTYLGDCEPVIAEKIEDLTGELLSRRLTDEEEAARIQWTADAIEYLRRQERDLEEEAPGLTAYGDYILNRVSDARIMGRWLSPDDIYGYVTENLKRLYPGTRVRLCLDGGPEEGRPASADRVADLDLAPLAKGEFERFLIREHGRSDTRLGTALGWVRCRFSNRTDTGRRGHEEVINQFHPVVRFIARRLDDPAEEGRLAAAVAIRVERSALKGDGASVRAGTYVLVVSAARFDGLRSSTHVRYAGKRIGLAAETLSSTDAECLATAIIGSGQPWPAARGAVSRGVALATAERLFEELSTLFDSVGKEEQAANDDRFNFRISTIDRQIRRSEDMLLNQASRHREQAAFHRGRGEVREARRRENLAKGAETRLRNERDRLEGRRATIRERRHVRYNPPEEVAAAVILVTESREESEAVAVEPRGRNNDAGRRSAGLAGGAAEVS